MLGARPPLLTLNGASSNGMSVRTRSDCFRYWESGGGGAVGGSCCAATADEAASVSATKVSASEKSLTGPLGHWWVVTAAPLAECTGGARATRRGGDVPTPNAETC